MVSNPASVILDGTDSEPGADASNSTLPTGTSQSPQARLSANTSPPAAGPMLSEKIALFNHGQPSDDPHKMKWNDRPLVDSTAVTMNGENRQLDVRPLPAVDLGHPGWKLKALRVDVKVR